MACIILRNLPFILICCQVTISSEPRGIFYLDAPSASVCLLIQLEKPATEEGGVTASVYSRKEPVCPGTFENVFVTFEFNLSIKKHAEFSLPSILIDFL